ncbi:unnamed protein product [Protopolystoma xenopodis]|uniref:Uncharacterized protein n=1 Tax=Protopolystoma xenopodis TaxID=117903 RepID=A0A3S5AZ25_9PLAT|nr:unnamed protein product [Protopolystoma xenopodis]
MRRSDVDTSVPSTAGRTRTQTRPRRRVVSRRDGQNSRTDAEGHALPTRGEAYKPISTLDWASSQASLGPTRPDDSRRDSWPANSTTPQKPVVQSPNVPQLGAI